MGALETGVAVHRDALMFAYLAMANAMAGRRHEAAKLLAELEQFSPRQYVFPSCFAYIQLGMDNHEAALDWLDRAFGEHDPHVLWLRASPRWDPVRRYPRFIELLRKVPIASGRGALG